MRAWPLLRRFQVGQDFPLKHLINQASVQFCWESLQTLPGESKNEAFLNRALTQTTSQLFKILTFMYQDFSSLHSDA